MNENDCHYHNCQYQWFNTGYSKHVLFSFNYSFCHWDKNEIQKKNRTRKTWNGNKIFRKWTREREGETYTNETLCKHNVTYKLQNQLHLHIVKEFFFHFVFSFHMCSICVCFRVLSLCSSAGCEAILCSFRPCIIIIIIAVVIIYRWKWSKHTRTQNNQSEM